MTYDVGNPALENDVDRLQRISYEIAQEKGWCKNGPIALPEQIALIHSEASEALESYRNNEPISWTDEHGKPQGVASEFADIFIRMGHYATQMGFKLSDEIERKLEYNKTRPYRHGGKAI